MIGGGPCTYNPEPLADFFDMFYIGEGEETYPELIRLYREHKAAGGHREAFLQKAATLPGIYVPSLYEVAYHADGTLASFTPKYAGCTGEGSQGNCKGHDRVLLSGEAAGSFY